MPEKPDCDELEQRVEALEEKLLLCRGIAEERQITATLLEIISSEKNLKKLMRKTTSLLRSWSGCSAVGVRLRDRHDFPYFETRGFPEEFVRAENNLCAIDEKNEPVRDSLGNFVLECMCGNVLSSRFDPSKPFFTDMGSFWTNSTTELFVDKSEAARQTWTRNRCNASGFESVALVPLRMEGETFGLLQFNDRHKGRFTEQRISLFESLATNLAMALAYRKAAAAAKEKQTEITKTNIELSLGLSEVFTALTEIASGNPAVRISETSELKPIAKLKHMVNMTAENLGEIVDLSHEFAMGLSEHFDVFNRVAQGDLAARVVGSSPMELLESLKSVTNETIESISEEIKERIKAEKEKRALEAKMYHAQKMEALGVLAASIAHDLNNLLMIIRAEATLILSAIDEQQPHVEKLKSIQEQVKNGARLVEQLLDFARTRGLETRPTNLAKLVEKTANLFASSLTDMTIHKNLEADTWKAEVDDAQIEQVLLNLYINAADAMPEGGDLYLQTENVIFEKDNPPSFNLKPGEYVKISVTDTGVGMDEDIRQRVFEPFFTTKEKGLGTGLGLASAFGIIKNHAGLIDVESKKGQGTTFHVYLPAVRK